MSDYYLKFGLFFYFLLLGRAGRCKQAERSPLSSIVIVVRNIDWSYVSKRQLCDLTSFVRCFVCAQI